ncbi:MAG: nucleotide-diphospho-sugar transferase [Clostridia bacterium]|nr:nucleotide-diphospho-sugar transferase [Clostridia bacterium]
MFEQVRKAKPKTLILAQDGARNENDIDGIEKCRKIAESVDWDCEIIRDYSEVNLGCGVRPQSAITNALERFESVIILEDDCVPSLSFFSYCEELLEKYKDDERICYISGLNHFEEWDCGGNDYFFTKTGAIWGWATWRRAWSKYYDYYVRDISNEYVANLLKGAVSNKHSYQTRIEYWKEANESLMNGKKLSYWDAQWGFVGCTQNMLVIVPKKNLIHNIGVGATSTHAQNLKMTTYVKYKNFVFIPTYEFDFPLKHPEFCICDTNYDNLVYKCMLGSPARRFIVKLAKKILKKLNVL